MGLSSTLRGLDDLSGNRPTPPFGSFQVYILFIPTCPPAIDKSQKLMKLISYKTLFISFGVYLYGIYVKLAGENMS
jgi:hypothetical protein